MSAEYLQLNPSFADATISFTHFTTLMNIENLTPEQLDESYHAGLAFVCPPNQKGADFIIPVRLAHGQFTAIFGQTKNYANAPASSLAKPATTQILPSEWLADNHPLHLLDPILTIYHQVGVDGVVIFRQKHLSITGLTSTRFASDVVVKLREICNTRVDAEAPMWVTSQGCGSSLHDYFPLVYPPAAPLLPVAIQAETADVANSV